MRGRSQRLTSVADLVARFFAKRHHHPDRAKEATAMKVFAAFQKIGPPITDHAEPIMLRGGVLTVNVTDSAWLTELAFLKKEILDRVNRGLPKPAVRDLRMKLGSFVRRREEKAKPPELSAEENARIEEWAKMIGSEDVREAMIRAAKWSIKRPRTGRVVEGPPGPWPSAKSEQPEKAAPVDRFPPGRDRWKK